MATPDLSNLSINEEGEEEGFCFDMEEEEDETLDLPMQGGPWTFDSHLLILEKVRIGVQIESIPLFHVDFWVKIHNLPAGMMIERLGRAMENFIGEFVEYDKNNNTSFWREYMRIRVKIDVRVSLKKQTKVKSKGETGV
ncbi:uncharacterized protein LOC131625555 [Vicia villosa]|uniref:uncharacterized protein LOC131625555 n=1 Tax=Vicia villosa TaxID=3911 RepID=UPI00273BCBB1|nr:uncharacterized protein LOC131625555 [Vicia villosa]